MKIILLAIGSTSAKWIKEGIEYYNDKLKHYVPFEIATLADIKKKCSEDEKKRLEGEMILGFLNTGDYVTLLDERGKQLTSVEFSRQLQVRMNSGVKRLVMVIGGPYGFSQPVYDRADAKMSLSAMTFTHEMARLILVEQLYRAMTIIKGEPYHHE